MSNPTQVAMDRIQQAACWSLAKMTNDLIVALILDSGGVIVRVHHEGLKMRIHRLVPWVIIGSAVNDPLLEARTSLVEQMLSSIAQKEALCPKS